jgi:hypothetical protein
MSMVPKTVCAVAVGLLAGAFGCAASVPPPNDQWAAAQADVGRAQSGGAPDLPEARLHLQLALEDLQLAKSLMGNDNSRARSLCALARVEAQLAFSLAKKASAEESARRAQAEMQASPTK